MLEFQPGAGSVVADDSKGAVTAADNALLGSLRLYMSFIEATRDSGLPAAQSQKVHSSITSGISAFVEGRGGLVAAIRQLNGIKHASNLAELDFGCPVWGEANETPVAVFPVTPRRKPTDPAVRG